MQKLPGSGMLSYIRGGRGFLFGLLTGAILATSGLAFGGADEKARNLTQSVLYTLAELAVNTETNATSIADLRRRLNDLELTVDEIAGNKK